MKDVGNSESLILPVPPAPFALIVGPTWHAATHDQLERAFRRMGLRPDRVDTLDPDVASNFAFPRFRLTFGSLSIVAGRASQAALDLMDPADPATSLLATVLPRPWRDLCHCWYFQPEGAEQMEGAGAEPAANPLLLMMLLIELLDASHLFWSAAGLWSDTTQFRAAMDEAQLSTMPPVLHLIAFRRQQLAEGGALVRTRGLALFGGQELESAFPPGWTAADMVKRLARVAIDIMIDGPVPRVQRVPGRERGEWIVLTPRATAKGGAATMVDVAFHPNS